MTNYKPHTREEIVRIMRTIAIGLSEEVVQQGQQRSE